MHDPAAAHVVQVLSYRDDVMYMLDEITAWINDESVYAPRIQFYWQYETLIFMVTFTNRADAGAFSQYFEGKIAQALNYE